MTADIHDLKLVKRHPEVGDHFTELLANIARMPTYKPVYPFYQALLIRDALAAALPTDIIVDVGSIETIGDCRYAITTRDHSGQKYRITVMVEK